MAGCSSINTIKSENSVQLFLRIIFTDFIQWSFVESSSFYSSFSPISNRFRSNSHRFDHQSCGWSSSSRFLRSSDSSKYLKENLICFASISSSRHPIINRNTFLRCIRVRGKRLFFLFTACERINLCQVFNVSSKCCSSFILNFSQIRFLSRRKFRPVPIV